MARQIRRHVRNNVVGYIALFLVLAGVASGSVTIAPRNSVVSSSIDNGQVKTPDLAAGAVTRAKVACKGNDPQDVMVKAGPLCVDRYEASVWSKPNGGTQFGVSSGNYPCADSGQDCKGKIFARSVRGVQPSGYITWFQAQAALANSGKRLPTNAEWQQAVTGTPDDTGPSTTPCNTRSGSAKNTGASAGCRSIYGVNDMVGNYREWTADWEQVPEGCGAWSFAGGDTQCFKGANAGTTEPAGLMRGDAYNDGTSAGPLAVDAFPVLSDNTDYNGFRGVR
jgi:formylglycine-generating enzyme required for sulfatase activity